MENSQLQPEVRPQCPAKTIDDFHSEQWPRNWNQLNRSEPCDSPFGYRRCSWKSSSRSVWGGTLGGDRESIRKRDGDQLTRCQWWRAALRPVHVGETVELLNLDPLFAFEAIKAGKHRVAGSLEHIAASRTACRRRQWRCGRKVVAVPELGLEHDRWPVHGLRRRTRSQGRGDSGLVDLGVHRRLGGRGTRSRVDGRRGHSRDNGVHWHLLENQMRVVVCVCVCVLSVLLTSIRAVVEHGGRGHCPRSYRFHLDTVHVAVSPSQPSLSSHYSG